MPRKGTGKKGRGGINLSFSTPEEEEQVFYMPREGRERTENLSPAIWERSKKGEKK